MNTKYTFSTPDHAYSINPHEEIPDMVVVESATREALEEMIGSIELAGAADGEFYGDEDDDFTHIPIWTAQDDLDEYYFIEITKATLCLYLNFEVLNYLGAFNNA